MVPRHPFNELTPKSGCAERNSPELTKKKIWRETSRDAKRSRIRFARRRNLWQRCVPFVIEQMREKLPHIARRIEVSGDALGAPANGKCKAVEIRHDRKHRFVGDIVADEERTPALERLVRHQFPHPARLCGTG